MQRRIHAAFPAVHRIIRPKANAPLLQGKLSRAGMVIAALMYLLLLSPVGPAEARSYDEGGRCVAVHQRLAHLRAEIAEVEKEAKLACSPAATPAATPLPLPPPTPPPSPLTPHRTAVAAARAKRTKGGALPVSQSRPSVGFTMSGGRRRQMSGTPRPYAYDGLRYSNLWNVASVKIIH